MGWGDNRACCTGCGGVSGSCNARESSGFGRWRWKWRSGAGKFPKSCGNFGQFVGFFVFGFGDTVLFMGSLFEHLSSIQRCMKWYWYLFGLGKEGGNDECEKFNKLEKQTELGKVR